MAIELKKGIKVNLRKKKDISIGEIIVNLNWNQKKSGFLFKSKAIDLGCLFELSDGRKGAIQALGESFGSLNRAPYISLDGDDRTGASENGENLRINGKMVSNIKKILVYTFIYEGAVNWEETQGIVTISYSGAPDIVIKLDEYNSSKKMCALTLLENVDNQTFSVEKIIKFFNGHRDLDAHFNWGLKWIAGRK